MMTNNFGNKSFMQPMRKAQPALKMPCYFLKSFLGGGGGEDEDFY
jgi:hypothetical protein